MPPKFTVKLKADVPRVVYSAAQREADWRLSVGMLRQLLLHAVAHQVSTAFSQLSHTRSAAAANNEEKIGTTMCENEDVTGDRPTHGTAPSSPPSSHSTQNVTTASLLVALDKALTEGLIQKRGRDEEPPQLHTADGTNVLMCSRSENEENRGGGGDATPPPPPLSLLGTHTPSPPFELQYSCEAVASSVRNLVCHGEAKQLYEHGLVRTLELFLPKSLDWLQSEVGSLEPLLAVKWLVFLWTAHSMALHHMAGVFADLGQGYILQHTTDRSLRGVGVRVFCGAVKQYKQGLLKRQFLRGYLDLVDMDRDGSVVDRSMLETARVIAVEAQLYYSELEPMLVKQTTAYYQSAVERLVYADCCDDGALFFRTIQRRLAEERERIASCFDKKSKAMLEEATQRALLEAHGASVLQSSFAHLAASESTFPVIRLAWKLLSMRYVGKGDAARASFREYILAQGAQVVNASAIPAAAAVPAPSTPQPHPSAKVQQQGPAEDPTITGLLHLYKRCQEIVKTSFDSIDAFSLTLREAMQTAIRPKEARTAEGLAKHIDSYLRDGARRETDEELEHAVSESMGLFAIIPGKDIFEAFYAELLSKRLVFQRFRSLDLERVVIKRVKELLGSSSSSKLEGMLKDMAVNDELNGAYQQHVTAFLHSVAQQQVAQGASADMLVEDDVGSPVDPGSPLLQSPCSTGSAFPADAPKTTRLVSPLATSLQKVDCKFQVLTVGYWPSSFPKQQVALPTALRLISDHFSQFYCSRHGGRRLQWVPTLSTCTLRAIFEKGGRKEIAMNLIQGIIMGFFNDPDAAQNGMSYQAMCDKLNANVAPQQTAPTTARTSSSTTTTPEGPAAAREQTTTLFGPTNTDLTCAVLSICGAPIQRLLLRTSGASTAAISPDEVFKVNPMFVHRQVKFRVNQVQLRDPQQDSQATKERAQSERSHVVDAAIVRYMKSRRRATHNDLINDVIAMLKFPAASGDVKKRLEVLIEREYVRRDALDAGSYEYVA